jgi:trk system potassium uptake protein TrkA
MKIIVVGAGKVGYNISRVLSEDHDVVVVDKDPIALQPVHDDLDAMGVVGNGASARVLEQVGVHDADMVIAVTDNDELNMIACMTAKQCGVRTTVARVRNRDYTSAQPFGLSYTRFGIDVMVSPEDLAAQEIFRLIEVPMATDVEYFAEGRLSLIGVKVSRGLRIAGKRIRDMGLDRFTVVAVIRKGRALIPDGNTVILPDDRVFVLGRTSGFHSLQELTSRDQHVFDRIVIAGGGLIVEPLIELLNERRTGPGVHVIERDPEKCSMYASKFGNCEIACADPTRMDHLEEEGVGEGDVFVAATGSDNSNLVSCIAAKRLGVGQMICEVSREDYIPLAEAVGVNATITPRLLVANSVLKLLRSSSVLSVNLLNSGDAEIMEVMAEVDSPVTKALLKDLNVPRGVVVGSVIHEGRIVVPRGDTRIMPGDHAIVFALHSVAGQAEGLFRAQNEELERSNES